MGTLSVPNFVDYQEVENVFTKNTIKYKQTATTTTLNGTLTLTASSKSIQTLNGTATGFSVVLPNATTLVDMWHYIVINNSTKSISVKNNAGTLLYTVTNGSFCYIYLQDNSTANGSWSSWQSSVPTNALKYIANQVYVATNGDDTGDGTHHNPYLTVTKALSTILDASDINYYDVIIGPGVYVEPNLVVPNYVNVRGESIESTIISASGNDHDVFSVGIGSEISFMTIKDAGPGYAGICADDCGDFGQCHKISIYNCDHGIHMRATTIDCQFYAEFVDINGTFSKGVYVESTNGFYSEMFVENFWTFSGNESATGTVHHSYVNGVNSFMNIRSGRLFGVYNAASSVNELGVDFGTNGGTLHIISSSFEEIKKAIAATNSTSVMIEAQNINMDSCENDFYISNTAVSGYAFGSWQRSKIYNLAANTLSLTYQDVRDGDFNNSQILATKGFAPEVTGRNTSLNNITYLTSKDTYFHYYDGSATGQQIELPNATTLRNGHQFLINNSSTQQMTVRQYGNTLPFTLNSFGLATMILKNNSTTSGIWTRAVTSASTFSGIAPVVCGYGGSAGSGRYLEFVAGNSSDNSPFICIYGLLIVGCSIAGTASTTASVGIYQKVGTVYTLLASISLASQSINYVSNLNIQRSAGNQISIKVISGSINKPFFALYIAGA